MALTGNYRFRSGFNGTCVLQVEVRKNGMQPYSRRVGPWNEWQDAAPMDLSDPALRRLIEAQEQPITPPPLPTTGSGAMRGKTGQSDGVTMS